MPHGPLGAITLQIVSGLQYLHREMKQVHRDLKPANVMLTSSGVAKLSDFGISKQLESTGAFAMTQVGTILYMAPERFSGGLYTLVSDVWSIGIMMIEALCGTHPYKDKSFIAISMAVTKHPAPATPADTPAEICEFIHLCLIKEHEQRPKVGHLLQGQWMKQASRTNAIHETARYLQHQKEQQAG